MTTLIQPGSFKSTKKVESKFFVGWNLQNLQPLKECVAKISMEYSHYRHVASRQVSQIQLNAKETFLLRNVELKFSSILLTLLKPILSILASHPNAVLRLGQLIW